MRKSCSILKNLLYRIFLFFFFFFFGGGGGHPVYWNHEEKLITNSGTIVLLQKYTNCHSLFCTKMSGYVYYIFRGTPVFCLYTCLLPSWLHSLQGKCPMHKKVYFTLIICSTRTSAYALIMCLHACQLSLFNREYSYFDPPPPPPPAPGEKECFLPCVPIFAKICL